MAHLSLFELNGLIKKTLDEGLENSYWVIAEIGEMRVDRKGHCYMELVEKEGNFISAKARATVWSYTYRTVSAWFESITQTSLQPGLKVLINATIQFHEVYGISLNVKEIDPNFTLGERARKRQEVIQSLINEGVFDMNREIRLPEVPQRVAIVSSENAAGYGDFMNHLKNNEKHFSFFVKLFPALMQGENASKSIIEALHHIHDKVEQFDMVTIIRGGGSQLDLDCFDDYELANHIAQFPLPVVTGIGHERDETVADLVAHTKMKTPTAVADFLISGLERFDDSLNVLLNDLHQLSSQIITDQMYRLSHLQSELKFHSNSRLNMVKMQINRLTDTYRYGILNSIESRKNNLEVTARNLKANSSEYFDRQKERLHNFDKQLMLMEPSSILKRGYTISRIKGKLLKDTKIKSGEEISTTYHEGNVTSIIKD